MTAIEEAPMSRQENEQHVRGIFDAARPRLAKLAAQYVDDAESVAARAAQIFDGLIPGMAYVDDPKHIMAESVFVCSVNLAAYLALKDHGVDTHEFGAAMIERLKNASVPPPAAEQQQAGGLKALIDSAAASQKNAKPNEFVFEVLPKDDSDFDWGMNIKSCAICHQCAKHDAMELVPYMCATDDVVSDKAGQGLQRTGSIALGAHHCDFRFKQGGEPKRLVEQYPDQIHSKEKK
jgi:hypothetical protein